MNDPVFDIEEALVGHWSHFGRWPKGALVEDRGTLRYETPIAHLPYNGVLRTRIEGDADEVIADVAAAFGARPFLWWATPSASPADLGARLERHGLSLVEKVTGMALELDGWEPADPRPGVDYAEVLDEEQLRAYANLIVSYWELPEDVRELVDDVNTYWRPGRVAAHRWLGYLDGRAVAKGVLSLAAPDGVAAIYGMSVLPEARGRGIAQGLTTALLRQARELGVRRVVLHSSEMAVGVYERAGFVAHAPLAVYATARIWSGRDH